MSRLSSARAGVPSARDKSKFHGFRGRFMALRRIVVTEPYLWRNHGRGKGITLYRSRLIVGHKPDESPYLLPREWHEGEPMIRVKHNAGRA